MGRERSPKQPRRARTALRQDARGATAVEYGLILALIVLSMFGALAAVGNQNGSIWNNIHGAVANAR